MDNAQDPEQGPMDTEGEAAQSGQRVEASVVDLGTFRLTSRTIIVPIVGRTPLIMEKWSKKALDQMADTQAQRAKEKKAARNPEADFRDAQYRLPDGRLSFPASAFKDAIVSGARKMDKMTMTSLKTSVFVHGVGPDQLVPLDVREEDVEMWTNPVRNSTGVADLRHRPRIHPWGAKLVIEFVEQGVSEAQVVALVEAGGWNGIGGWRPGTKKSLSGSYGMFGLGA